MQKLFSILLIVASAACFSGEDSRPEHPQQPYVNTTAFSQYIIVGDSLMDWSSGDGGELTTTASLMLLEENKSVTNISLAGQTMAGFNGKGGAEKDGVSGGINYLTGHGKHFWHRKPGTAVIIGLAHNDWWASTSAEVFFDSYVRFLEAIDRSELVSVFCIVPVAAKWDYTGHKNKRGMTYEAYRIVVREVAETGLCNLIDTSDWFTKKNVYDPLIMSDGLHLAAGGHRIYKDRLIEELGKYK
jgi:GDSL-like Lipase/Acylhydrolase family